MSQPEATVCLIRHGYSAGQAHSEFINGRSNELALEPIGEQQAYALGQFMLLNHLRPDHVESSPAVRAYRTGEIALGAAGLEYDPIIADGLQEIDMGEGTGLFKKDVYTPEMLAEIRAAGKDHRMPGGQSMNDKGQEMLDWLYGQERDGVTYAFGHGFAIRCLLGTMLEWPHQQLFETKVANTSLTRLDYQGGKWVPDMDQFAVVPHLPDDLVTY